VTSQNGRTEAIPGSTLGVFPSPVGMSSPLPERRVTEAISKRRTNNVYDYMTQWKRRKPKEHTVQSKDRDQLSKDAIKAIYDVLRVIVSRTTEGVTEGGENTRNTE